VRTFSARTTVAALLLLSVVLGQSQEIREEKTTGVMAEFTPVTLSMKWSRGDRHYGPNFIWLSAPCQSNVSCECTMEFKVINSQEFADYIASFGDAPVPVVYQVLYGPSGVVQGTRLESVGSWRAERFHANDQQLGIHFNFKSGKPGQKQTAHFHSPADCFPPKAN
jgi:hypothetical protein